MEETPSKEHPPSQISSQAKSRFQHGFHKGIADFCRFCAGLFRVNENSVCRSLGRGDGVKFNQGTHLSPQEKSRPPVGGLL
jgi:hypothetical protein